MMTQADDVVWQQIYNLILNPRTREWERQVLVETKDNVNGFSLNTQLDQLKSELKPLAVRRNLTPDVMDFYLR
ncbi:bacteriocin immunity protein [Leuconostoc pseudomesenteroides]|uniref:bacteriocin immunity protein n=1 Tax=Leuconostoc pseudomesenteroides TaxID=33968 RepID=UPI0039824D69